MEKNWAMIWSAYILRGLGVLGGVGIFAVGLIIGGYEGDIATSLFGIVFGPIYCVLMFGAAQFMEWLIAMEQHAKHDEENSRVSANALAQIANRKRAK